MGPHGRGSGRGSSTASSAVGPAHLLGIPQQCHRAPERPQGVVPHTKPQYVARPGSRAARLRQQQAHRSGGAPAGGLPGRPAAEQRRPPGLCGRQQQQGRAAQQQRGGQGERSPMAGLAGCLAACALLLAAHPRLPRPPPHSAGGGGRGSHRPAQVSWGQGTRAWLWLVGWLDWPAGQLVRLRRRPPSAAGELAACAMDARLLPHMGEQHAANWGAAAPAAAHIAARRLAGRTQAPALLLSPQHSAAGYATLRLHAAVLSEALLSLLSWLPFR